MFFYLDKIFYETHNDFEWSVIYKCVLCDWLAVEEEGRQLSFDVAQLGRDNQRDIM